MGGGLGGGIPHEFFLKKLVFEKKNAEAVARVLGRIFHPATRG